METPSSPPPTLLTVQEAAAILKLSASTVYRWSCTNKNPALFVRLRSLPTGGRPPVRIDPVRLAAYIGRGHSTDSDTEQ